MKSATEIRDWMTNYLAEHLRIDQDAIDADRSLDGYMNSILAVAMVGDLQAYVGAELPQNLVYQHPTINALAQALAGPAAPK